MKKNIGFTKPDDKSVPESQILVDRAIQFAEAGQSEKALQVLSNSHSASQEVLNARGVCLLRLARAEDALRVFRSLVLSAGGIWMKPELPVIYRSNFATSLLLRGNYLGVRQTLSEIPERTHPSVVRLLNSVSRWENSLTWWQRLGWRVGLAPDVPIKLDFSPGDIVDPLAAPVIAPPSMNSSGPIPNHQVA